MSCGLVICNKCKREVHQKAFERAWFHCEDKTPMCEAATAIYPQSRADIAGTFCGADDLDDR